MKNKNIFAALFFLCISISGAFAQLSVQIVPPPPSQLSVSELFRFTVINNSQTTYHVILEGVLSASSTQPVYTVRYVQQDIKPGINSFDYSNLQNKEQFYGNSTQAQTLRGTGIVPSGSYVLCINVNDAMSGAQLATNCLEQQFGPMSPPVLLSPDDEAGIQEKNPLLTWLPPSPIGSTQKLSYEIKMVEMTDNQSAYDAIMHNPIIFSESDLSLNNLVYPPDAYPLEYGKKYAWQVTVTDGTYKLGSTEVWWFKVVKQKDEKDSTPIKTGSFVKLKPTLDGSYSIVISELRFVYDNPFSEGNLRYRITDMTGKDVTPKDVVLQRKTGDNRYSIPLEKKAKLKNKTFYLLEVYGPKNDRNTLMFKYFKNENAYNKTN